MSKALFLDRDGTLVVDTHYLHKPEDLQLIAGIGDALRTAVKVATYFSCSLTSPASVVAFNS